MLTWDQLKEMAAAGVIIGAHTRTHPVLAALDEGRMEEEIRGAKSVLETKLGRSVDHFAYPYGSPGEVNEDVVAMTEKAGYRSAAVLYHDRFEHKNLFRLERMMVPTDLITYPWGGFSRAMFGGEITGLFDILLWRRTRRSGWPAATSY